MKALAFAIVAVIAIIAMVYMSDTEIIDSSNVAGAARHVPDLPEQVPDERVPDLPEQVPDFVLELPLADDRFLAGDVMPIKWRADRRSAVAVSLTDGTTVVPVTIEDDGWVVPDGLEGRWRIMFEFCVEDQCHTRYGRSIEIFPSSAGVPTTYVE